ncbi:MAG: aldehyde dehydrogenase [Ichthyobacteriaceae bacterium]|nr:aldehyde dehydrogenase [Ichthyobacteriaceae bacterium]
MIDVLTEVKVYQQYINGEWVESESTEMIEVLNPVTEEVISVVPKGAVADAEKALQAAKNAQDAWEDLPAAARGEYLKQMAVVITENRVALAETLANEQAKVIGLAQVEIDATAAYFDYYAGWARRIEGEIIQSDRPGEIMYLHKHAIGVAVGILPWNFPFFVMARKVAAALITGNTIVVKPSQEAPNVIMEWMQLVNEKMSLPAGVLNFVNGAGSIVGQALSESPITGIISLTGSVGAGQKVMEAAAKNITKVSLELGGKAPAIVAKDADLDMAVKAVVDSRLIFSGQVCNCAERVYVAAEIYDEFVARAKKLMSETKVSHAFDGESAMSSMVSQNQVDKVEGMVNRAIEAGAKLETGGEKMKVDGKGFFFQPTLLTNVTQDSEIIQEEIFGPVLPVMKFNTIEEAVKMANDSEFGLTSSVYSNDYNTIMYVQKRLKFGEVYINREHFEAIQGYHAGWRKSGIGGADGKHGMEEYLVTKVVYSQAN